MPKTGEGVDDAERLAAHADRNKAAWQRTLDDLRSLAADREAEGYETVAVAAEHTAPKSRDAGDTDAYGLVYVVPDNRVDALRAASESMSDPRYEVYRGATETRVFLVTELFDPDAETAVLVAGNYERRPARGLIRNARETGRMYSHLKLLDGTHLGSFAHGDPEKFFAPADFSAYEPQDGG